MHECLFSLSLVSQIQDADGAQDLQLTAGQVEFDRVSFSYVPGCVANILGPLQLSVCVLFLFFFFLSRTDSSFNWAWRVFINLEEFR